MTSGQMELLVSKIVHAAGLHAQHVAEMVRAYWKECETGISPPDMEDGFQGGFVNQSENENAVQPGVKFEPPFEPLAPMAESGVDPVVKARLVGRYKFRMSQARVLRFAAKECGEELLSALRSIRADAAAAGVRLELSPYDPTGTSPAGEKLADARSEPPVVVVRPPRRKVQRADLHPGSHPAQAKGHTTQRKRKNVKK